jgi:hypothetical protein
VNARMLALAVVLGLSGVVQAGPNVAVGVTIGGPPVPYYRPVPPPFWGPPVGYYRPYPPPWAYQPYYGGVYVAPVVATPVVVVERPRPVVVEVPPAVEYQAAPRPAPAPPPATSAYPPAAGASNPLPLPAGSLPLPPPPAPYYPRR